MEKHKTKSKISIFFKQEYKKMLSYINKFIDNSYYIDSEDIIQDVMLNLFKKTDIMEPIENLGGYVYTSLKNRAIDVIRGKKDTSSLDQAIKEDDSLTLKDILCDMRYDVSNEVEKNYIKNKLYNAISSLDSDSKSVMLATEFENLTFEELSESWSIPIGTLLSRKSRAIKKLKDILLNNI